MSTTDTDSTTAPLGDPLPEILAAYYDAIDGDRFEDAAATFSPLASTPSRSPGPSRPPPGPRPSVPWRCWSGSALGGRSRGATSAVSA